VDPSLGAMKFVASYKFSTNQNNPVLIGEDPVSKSRHC
jgi:hypothetical protein